MSTQLAMQFVLLVVIVLGLLVVSGVAYWRAHPRRSQARLSRRGRRQRSPFAV